MLDPIVLTFVVCLADASARCETRALDAPFPTPTACLMAGLPEAAKWLHDHPAYRLARWRCGREEKTL